MAPAFKAQDRKMGLNHLWTHDQGSKGGMGASARGSLGKGVWISLYVGKS